MNRREMLFASAAIGAPLLSNSRRGPRTSDPTPACEAGNIYSFKLGDLDVTAVSDAEAVIDGPHPIVGEDQQPELVQSLMRENLLPEKRFQPGFTPTLVRAGKELVLFDTGNGANGFVPRPYGGQLAKQLGLAGIKPESVTIVVLTHTHPDHVAGLMEDGKPTFPNARYVLGQIEHDFWARGTWRSASTDSNDYRTGLLFESHLRPYRERITLLKGEGEVVTGIHAIPAYGHTPGHLAFHIESRGQRLLLWGDCAHHEVASLAHPEWHAFFDMDKAAGAATRRRIYDLAARERLPVVGYHSSFPSVGYVQRQQTGYRWVPVTYQFKV
jgi:glyoxylase-like metal-dependent hydrolase (beta-lactamase superfamily II)